MYLSKGTAFEICGKEIEGESQWIYLSGREIADRKREYIVESQ